MSYNINMFDKIDKIKAGIIGANGYTGLELLRMLAAHPYADVAYAGSRSQAGESIAAFFPSLAGAYGGRIFDAIDLNKASACDVVFAALPHGQSAEICGQLIDMGTKVIDLSADFRYDDISLYENVYKIAHPRKDLYSKAVYGLPEFNRAKIKGASLIGNPGCYVTASVLAVKPLADAGVINKNTVIIDAKSGVSGAGRKADAAYNFNELDGNFKAYGVTTHRHMSEIEEKAGVTATFTPHLLPVVRGILSTIYCDLTAPYEKAVDAYKVYKNEKFVHYTGDIMPELSHAVGSNCCFIGTKFEAKTNRIIIVSVIDNLIKGASGQAVQNMNIMFGFDETCGLSLTGWNI